MSGSRFCSLKIRETTVMSLFSKNKEVEVQRFIVKLINNQCPGLKALFDDPRRDSRVNVVVVVWIIPIENGRPQAGQAFAAVSKEFSSTDPAASMPAVWTKRRRSIRTPTSIGSGWNPGKRSRTT